VHKALPRLIAAIAFLLVPLAPTACGKKSDTKVKDDAPAKPPVAPLALPTLGVDRVGRFNFIYGDGQPAYDKAVTAYKAKSRDWGTVRANCEAALAKDAQHLDAHRLLATALAQTGENAAAVDHLVTAIAGDYYKYAPSLASDGDLKAFLATSHGQAVGAAADQIKAEYAKRTKDALWVVGRRSTFKWPKDLGVQLATSRGELYAYDREAKRFYRLTHTDHQVAGFVRSPSGAEVVLLGFDKIDRPKDDGAPLVARAWIQAVDTTEWKASGPRTTVAAAREVSVGYGAGDELLVAMSPASGRWTTGAPTVSSIDRTTGKLTKVTTNPPVPRIVMTLDEGHFVRAPEGTEAAWSGDPPTTTRFKTAAGGTVQIPETGQASQASLSVAPGGARVAFATAVDPCAKDAAPSLYVADAKTGTFKHVLTAKSRFATRWLDGNVLAYEDGDGAIRLWDATTNREAMRLDDKAGLALDVLSLASAPLCKQAPPTAEPAGSDEPLPPEEPTGGPVTAPQ
jgi:hypothetical protein